MTANRAVRLATSRSVAEDMKRAMFMWDEEPGPRSGRVGRFGDPSGILHGAVLAIRWITTVSRAVAM